MSKKIYILNGPNLNLLGTREPEIYGSQSLEDIAEMCAKKAAEFGLEIEFHQSNKEGDLVDWVQEAGQEGVGLILNCGAYSHTSIAILDALKSVNIPAIEVHLSNLFTREEFRQHSYITLGVTGLICGLGAHGYELAIEALARKVK